MRFSFLAAIAAAASGVWAIDIDAPASGGSASLSSGTLNVKFSGAERNTAVLIITLMAGGDTEDTAGILGSGTLNTPPASGTIPIDVPQGPSDKNAYFIKIQANSAVGGQSITYSDRFTIRGMTGNFPAAGTTTSDEVEAAYKKVANDVKAVPEATDAVAPPAAGAAATGEVIAYSLQTDGASKIAPMQPQPPKKMTKTDMKPLYPTTAFKLAKSALPTPQFKITQTIANTHTAISRPHPATPAPDPQDDMQKFLNRWRD